MSDQRLTVLSEIPSWRATWEVVMPSWREPRELEAGGPVDGPLVVMRGFIVSSVGRLGPPIGSPDPLCRGLDPHSGQVCEQTTRCRRPSGPGAGLYDGAHGAPGSA